MRIRPARALLNGKDLHACRAHRRWPGRPPDGKLAERQPKQSSSAQSAPGHRLKRVKRDRCPGGLSKKTPQRSSERWIERSALSRDTAGSAGAEVEGQGLLAVVPDGAGCAGEVGECPRQAGDLLVRLESRYRKWDRAAYMTSASGSSPQRHRRPSDAAGRQDHRGKAPNKRGPQD